MEALIGVMLGAVITQGALLWYKMGKLEEKVAGLTEEIRNNNNTKKE